MSPLAVALLIGGGLALFTLGALFGAAITETNRRDEAAAMARHPAGKALPVNGVVPIRRPQ